MFSSEFRGFKATGRDGDDECDSGSRGTRADQGVRLTGFAARMIDEAGCRADALVRGRPPGRPTGVRGGLDEEREMRVRGTRAGEGARPTNVGCYGQVEGRNRSGVRRGSVPSSQSRSHN